MIETSPALKGIAAHLRKDPRIGKDQGAVSDESEAAIRAALDAAMFFAKDEETAIKGLTHALIDLAPANAVVAALFFIAHWTAEGGAE